MLYYIHNERTKNEDFYEKAVWMNILHIVKQIHVHGFTMLHNGNILKKIMQNYPQIFRFTCIMKLSMWTRKKEKSKKIFIQKYKMKWKS